jgi:hypothetical protein
MEDINLLKKYFVPELFQQQLTTKSLLVSYFKDNQISIDNLFFDRYMDYLCMFSDNYADQLKEYFQDKVALTELSNHFIQLCLNSKLNNIAPESVLKCWDRQNNIVETEVWQSLKQYKYQNINFFSYGIGNAEYELNLKIQFESKLKGSMNLYGYDPYSSDQDKFITLGKSDKNIRLDFILSRWVLHHVEPNLRWSELKQYLTKLNSKGSALIIEHGYKTDNKDIPYQKLSDLLNATYDVMTNYYLRPSGFIGHNEDDNNFYVNYLNTNDISSITKGFYDRVESISSIFPKHHKIMIKHNNV